MNVIIAGSRHITDANEVLKAILESGFKIDSVSYGMAKGVDMLADQIARYYGVSSVGYPANWNKYGKGAGPIRNQEMADNNDALIAVWDGKSHGTNDMIQRAKAKGLKVYIHLVTGEEHGENYRAEGL